MGGARASVRPSTSRAQGQPLYACSSSGTQRGRSGQEPVNASCQKPIVVSPEGLAKPPSCRVGRQLGRARAGEAAPGGQGAVPPDRAPSATPRARIFSAPLSAPRPRPRRKEEVKATGPSVPSLPATAKGLERGTLGGAGEGARSTPSQGPTSPGLQNRQLGPLLRWVRMTDVRCPLRHSLTLQQAIREHLLFKELTTDLQGHVCLLACFVLRLKAKVR